MSHLSILKNATNCMVAIAETDQLFFSSDYHSHDELELVYIKTGTGKRIIGNSIETFSEGELVLTGPNLPHVWHCNETSAGVSGISMHFNNKIFSDSFYEMNETKALKQLFSKSCYGIYITGHTKDCIALKLQQLIKAEGFEKIIGLFNILNIIATSSETCCINKEIIAAKPISERLSNVLNYIQTNIHKNIGLAEVAAMAGLTPESFCRYFKQKTGNTFIDYLQEKRIQIATQSLLNTDLTSAEIAYQTGFKTASGFNKLFKKITGYCPTEYRKAATVS